MILLNKTFIENIDYKIEDKGYKTPCWIWLRKIGKKGYGTIRYKNGHWKTTQIHRYLHCQKYNIDIESPLHGDHLCRIRECMNPDHVEMVSIKVNVLRGESPFAKKAKQTHCPNCGGEYQEKRDQGRWRRFCNSCATKHRRENRNRVIQVEPNTGRRMDGKT